LQSSQIKHAQRDQRSFSMCTVYHYDFRMWSPWVTSSKLRQHMARDEQLVDWCWRTFTIFEASHATFKINIQMLRNKLRSL
jgi:hypothetical protein